MTDRSAAAPSSAGAAVGTARQGSVRVVFVHGVGGPVPGWDAALRAALHARAGDGAPLLETCTVRYDHVFARPAGAEATAVGARTPDADDSARGAVPTGRGAPAAVAGPHAPSAVLRRSALERIVRDAADAPGGTDGAGRLWLPKVLPSGLVVRWPFSGMPHALAYREDPAAGDAVRAEVASALALPHPGTRVLIAHSLGSVVALDALVAGAAPVDLLVTIGSPLGIDADWSAHFDPVSEFPHDRIGAWLNVVNTRDPIPWNRGVAGRFPQAVDAFITAGLLPVGRGGAHDPAVYTGSPVVVEAVLAAVAGWSTGGTLSR